jgi:hypothetical protein
VDYLILSSNLFSVIKNFDVLDYDPLFSDVHCDLQFSFSVDICLLSAENRNISQPVNWDNCKKDESLQVFLPIFLSLPILELHFSKSFRPKLFGLHSH